MTACLDENSVIDYLQGWMTEERRGEIEEHVDACERCHDLVAEVIRDDTAPADEYRLGDELVPGTMIEHFQVMRMLGHGAMGEVYLCRDSKLGRRVALKVVRASSLGTAAAVDQFLEEARNTARFSHPHIVTIHAASVWRGLPYLALEYLEGQTLKERLEQERLGVAESIRISLAVAAALKEAHRHKVLHRDLKPGNVLLPRDGRPRVVDFGLSVVMAAEQSTPAAGGGAGAAPGAAVCGTPSYMAPEQWLAEKVSEGTDVWALGVMMHELLTGRRPYRGATPASLGVQVVSAAPVPLPAADLALPPLLVDLVSRCLDKRPGRRPSAGQVEEALAALLGQQGRTGARSGAPIEASPFRGLLPFREEHAELFFGRDSEVAAFVERIRQQGVLPVVGPSGAGKTSFVQAGALPRLRDQGRWRVLKFRPGDRPFDALTRTLRRGGIEPHEDLARSPMHLNLALRWLARREDSRVLLFVDQLEEVCTLGDPGQRDRQVAFVEALCGAGDDPEDPVRVVFTLRDDFLGRLALGPRAREALGSVTIIRVPEAEALEQIITRPLAAHGYAYDDARLPGAMVQAVRGEPAALPLLQFTTRLLWERREPRRRRLLRAVYEEIGGVAGALARQADGVLEGLAPDEVRTVRDLLLRLVTPGRTRKTVDRSSLVQGLLPAADSVLDRLIEGRLVSVRRGLDGAGGSEARDGEGARLELAHESLIGDWNRLARWIDESHEELVFLAEATQAADLWIRRGRRADEVWHGDALREARRTIERCTTEIPGQVVQFMALGTRLERRRQARRRLRLLGGMAALVLIAAVAVVVSVTLSQKKRQAERQRAEAQREGARSALLQGELLEARAKLRASLETSDSARTRLLWWRASREPLIWKRVLGSPVNAVDFSPDGKALAVACADRSVYLFDPRTNEVQRQLRGHADQVLSVAFSPGGGRLASGSWDGQVRIWDLGAGGARRLNPAHAGAVSGISFSPDGTLLATGSADKSIQLWRVRDGARVRRLAGHTSGVYGVAFSPDGALLASGSYDRSVRIWDTGTGAPVRTLAGHTATVYRVRFAPDGRRLASSGADRRVLIWDVRTGARVRSLVGHAAGVSGLAFSPDGRRLATGGYDKSVRLWTAATGQQVGQLPGHTAGVVGVRFSPDGKRLATVSRDRSLRIWRVDDLSRAPTRVGHAASVWSVSFSPDGARVATASKDETIRLWNVQTGAQEQVLTGHTGGVLAVAFSHDGALLASGSSDHSVRLWRADTGRQVRILSGHTSEVYSLSFGPDDRQLVTGGYDRTVRVWETATGRQVRALRGHTGAVYGVAFSPDGASLASSSYDRTARIWDASTGQQRRLLTGHEGTVYGVAFSPDGRSLITGSADHTVRVWDLATGAGQVARRYGGRVYWLTVHRDGRRVGVPVSDGTARILDLSGPGRVTLRGHRGEVNAMRFSPDGRLAATTGDDGTLRLWRLDRNRPFWRAPVLLPATLELYAHGRWRGLSAAAAGGHRPRAAAPSRWRSAISPGTAAAAQASDAKTLCLWSDDGWLELWDLAADRRLIRERATAVEQLLVLGEGCVARSRGEVRMYRPGRESQPLVAAGASAMSLGRGRLMVAAGRRVQVLAPTGAPVERHEAEEGISALARSARWLILGYSDGNIELIAPSTGKKRERFSFKGVPSSPVTRLVLAAMDTLIAGFADGTLGVWNLETGTRLHHDRLHGPVDHLLIKGGVLHAATGLGDHASWDLSVLHTSYCELLRDVWAQAPAIWTGGRPVLRPPPARHRACAPR